MKNIITQSQLEKIENILYAQRKIDNFFCIDTRLTTRLGAYIHILRTKGYDIQTQRNYENTRNTFYFLIKAPKQRLFKNLNSNTKANTQTIQKGK